MKLSSLGQLTELIVKHDVQVRDHDNMVVIRMPSEPSYFWGNYVIFKKPPSKGDVHTWANYFDEAFSDIPDIKHKSLTWDRCDLHAPCSPEVISEFEKAGYDYDCTVFLKANDVCLPAMPNKDIEIRPIGTNDEWDKVLELQVLCRGDFEIDVYRSFLQRRVTDWKALSNAGRGQWFGAFKGDLLVGDAGIFWNEEIARFQHVETHFEHRRQGICGTLVYHMSKFALEKRDVKTLVIAADEDYHAARIYETLSFERFERTGSFGLHDKKEWNKVPSQAI